MRHPRGRGHTRGGEASYPTQDAAISLAKEQGDELIFLYVADISFLNQTAAPLVVDVESRLEKLGRFQLVMAQERAAAQGIMAQTIVRKGMPRSRPLPPTCRPKRASRSAFWKRVLDSSSLMHESGNLEVVCWSMG